MASPGGGQLGRSWRRFRRRPVLAQGAALAVVLVLLVGIVFAVAGSGSSSGPRKNAKAGAVTASVTPPDKASLSSAGVTAHTINVVFPISNLQALSLNLGFATDIEYTEQSQAIKLFVKQINDNGGIHGRKINPIIVTFDPTSETDMRALCKDWTEGSPAAFAVVDGEGSWTGDDQLCVTQEGQTPFIGAWTTVTNWTQMGSPYLWWTGTDQAAELATLVQWGKSAGLLGGNRKVGVVAGDRASDQLALNQYLLPDLRNAGITPVVETIAAGISDSATTSTEAPLIIQKLRSAGVQSVIPLVPFNAFFPLIGAETQQTYFPKLLLSDYESSVTSALGLIPIPYNQALNGQEGITTLTLGGFDDARPESQGGYDPGTRACFTTWHKAYPKTPKGLESFYIEEQGPIALWCQAIRLFAAAARAAGPDLNRRTFVTAMSHVTGFPGTNSPVLSYGPDKRFGPTSYQVVRLHINSPLSTQCALPKNRIPQVTCWVQVQPFTPLPPP